MADGIGKVTLNIRNPCLDEAKEMEASLKWTVLQVKKEVEKSWPEHPKPADQRLIYSGKLLENDSCLLEDVLRLEEGWNSHTIHLVCRQLSAKANAKSGLRQRPSAVSQPEPTEATDWQMPSSPDHQQLIMHQMYAHYLQHYIHYVNQANAASSGQTEHHPMPQELPVAAAAAAAVMMGQQVPQGPPPGQTIAEQTPNAGVPNAGEGVANAAVGDGNLGNAVMNAGAGAVGALEDDEEFEGGQRDLLDWFYVASRVLVLFSIVYFYSSFARFALVMGFGFIFYLYRIGAFGPHHVEPPAAAQAPNDEGEDDIPGPGHQTPREERQQPWYAVATTFVTTFFTSLMPANPQQVI